MIYYQCNQREQPPIKMKGFDTMAKEFKVKAWKTTMGGIVISHENIPPLLQEKVNKFALREEFTLTLSISDPREDWIEKWYKKAKEDDDVVFLHHKTVTICTAYWGVGENIAISDVCKGDTYDRKTGIAVAYAKFCRELIPDFI
jgi:hypothetical protein